MCATGTAMMSNATRLRLRNTITLPFYWPRLPNCDAGNETRPCACTGNATTDGAPATEPLAGNHEAAIAAANNRANTYEALFIAFLVLLLLSWLAVACILFKQRQRRRGNAEPQQAQQQQQQQLYEASSFQRPDIAQYDHAPSQPSLYGSVPSTDVYAAPSSVSSSEGQYAEPPRTPAAKSVYTPVVKANSGPRPPQPDMYTSVPQTFDSLGAPSVTTYVPVPRGGQAPALSPRRPTGLPSPIAVDFT
jgi:hypothetical protein